MFITESYLEEVQKINKELIEKAKEEVRQEFLELLGQENTYSTYFYIADVYGPVSTTTLKKPTILERIKGIEKHLGIQFNTEEVRKYEPIPKYEALGAGKPKRKAGRPKGSKNKK